MAFSEVKSLPLQWGRSIRAAESGVYARLASLIRASMGPQHKSCGEPELAQAVKSECQASMGPQHKSCGE